MRFIRWLISLFVRTGAEAVTKNLDNRRADQAHEDLGAATERAKAASDGLAVSEAMAGAQIAAEAPGAAETALEQGHFLLSPSKPAAKMRPSRPRGAKAINKGRRK